jgi:predicted nucleic acid-binding protein
MSLVLDASVVIKWFVEEPLHAHARHLLEIGESLHAPDLLVAEVGNVAWKKAIRGEIGADQARAIALALRELPLALHASGELMDRAMQMALAVNHPVYDCLYIACAEMLDGTLFTADERLHRSVAATSLAGISRTLASLERQ